MGFKLFSDKTAVLYLSNINQSVPVTGRNAFCEKELNFKILLI